LKGEIACRKVKGPFIESECLMAQRDFQWGGWVSDSSSNSGAGVEERARDYSAGPSVTHF